ncbi:MAG TPA: hypothetical protein VFZ65_00105, partial [Planctomycetota bacterium]|nr:hypothetical protein [Planctomycetota bacterium]
PAWPAHERPWDFWRFSSESFDALLNRHTGFRILKRAEGMPAAILPLVRENTTKHMLRHPCNLCVGVLAEKVGSSDARLAWNLNAADVVAEGYPGRPGA